MVDELNAHCRNQLSSYKRPRYWYFAKEFPTTEAGKLRKFILRDMILNGELKETTE
jgi:long-chain acyl-CoA synthetase